MKKSLKIDRINLKQSAKNYLKDSVDSNEKIAGTIAVGIFASILPIWGFQSVIAISIAMFFRLNKLIAYAVSNISQPPLTPFIIFFSYIIGGIVLSNGSTEMSFSDQFSLENVEAHFYQYVIGSLVFAAAMAAIMWTSAYTLLCLLRKKKKMLKDKGQGICM